MSEMSELPTGTVTFLFTDIEGSTKLLRELGENYVAVLEEHHRILRKAVAEQGGREIDSQGDSFFFAFERANAALGAAVLAQRALAEQAWPEEGDVRVRMGLHTGEPIVGEERYVGLGVHRAARIGAVAHGGQVLLSTATRELIENGLAGVSIRDLGSYRLKDLDRDERLYQLDVAGLQSDFPPLRAPRVAEPRPVSQAEVHIGAEFLGYRIEELIGQGGMGVVYRAYDLRLKRTVALKLVTPELALDERFRERFMRETELAMSLEHPNVVPIHDAGEVAGRLYLAMRLVAGSDLRALLHAGGALEPSRALAICTQVASALDAAHARALVHRDVKPSNVLLDESEHVYLADFGLTRRLEEQGAEAGEGRSLGTPAYLAPEQIEGRAVDGRGDVYSLGCLLFECLTGEAPYRRDSRLATAWAHLEEEPPRASQRNSGLPKEIDAVFDRALAKEPEERYPTCSALMEAAGEALGLGVPRRGHLGRRLLAGGVAAALAAGAVTAFLVRGGGAAPTVVPNSLVKIDAKTGRLADVFPVGRRPGEVELLGRYVFVTSTGDGTLTRVDTRSGQLVSSGQYAATWGLAAQGHRRLWVASTSRLAVTAVDTELPEVDPLGGPSRLEVPLQSSTSPPFLAVGGGSLWISSSGDAVERWSLGTLNRQARYPLHFGEYGLDVAYGYGAAWIALGAPGNAVLRIDPRSGHATRIRVGRYARGTATGFGSVWVAMGDDHEVWRLNPSRSFAQAFIEVGKAPLDVAVGAGSVWVTNHCDGTVSRIDPRSNAVVDTIRLGYHPAWLAAGDGSVWIGVLGKPAFPGACSPL
jgi:serine/threonine-protein kinase